MIVLTPVYIKSGDSRFTQRKSYFEESMRSVRAQDESIRHIIIDDGSPKESLQEIKDKSTDCKTTFLRRERQPRDLLTCTNALNYGLDYVLSSRDVCLDESISFLHSDDLLINGMRRVQSLSQERSRFLYSDAVIFFDNNPEGIVWEGLKGINRGRLQDFWIRGRLPYPTMTWTKSLLLDLKEFILKKYGSPTILDPNVGCGENVDLALSTFEFLTQTEERYTYLPQITAGYRIHSESLAEIRDQKARREEENSVLVKHFGIRKLIPLHLQKFFCRPEEYLPFLFPLALKKRKKVNLEELFQNE